MIDRKATISKDASPPFLSEVIIRPDPEDGDSGNEIKKSLPPLLPGWGDFALLIIALGALILWLTFPRAPQLPAYKYGQPRKEHFIAGEGCSGAPVNAESIAQRAERCRIAKEAYRQQSDDLVQQTRAADAAQAQASIAYTTAWASSLQTIGGLLTLIAASFAAYYARQAAVETRRGAKAARRQLKLARQLGEIELRSHISIVNVHARLAAKVLSLKFSFENSGTTIAKDLIIVMFLRAYYDGNTVDIDNAYVGKVNSVGAKRIHDNEVVHFASDDYPDLEKFLTTGLAFISLRIDVAYSDYFRTPRGTKRSYGIRLSQLSSSYTEVFDRHIVNTEKYKKAKNPKSSSKDE